MQGERVGEVNEVFEWIENGRGDGNLRNVLLRYSIEVLFGWHNYIAIEIFYIFNMFTNFALPTES